jgi:hypothetical protein
VVAVEIGRPQFGHGADAGDGEDFALLGAHQDGRLAAETEVREFKHRGRQHGGDSGVHRVAAGEEHAHAGFGGASEPAATAPRSPREGNREGNGRRICPHPVAIANASNTASLRFIGCLYCRGSLAMAVFIG